MGEPYGEEARELGEVSSRSENCELMRSSTFFHFTFQALTCISSKMAAHSTPLHYLFIYYMPSKWQSKWAKKGLIVITVTVTFSAVRTVQKSGISVTLITLEIYFFFNINHLALILLSSWHTLSFIRLHIHLPGHPPTYTRTHPSIPPPFNPFIL